MTNHWDERFSDKEYLYGKRPNAFIEDMLPKLEVGSILALAEGEGRNAVYAAKLGHNVTAWDYSKVGLEKMSQLAEEAGVEITKEEVDLTKSTEWPKEAFDIVFNIFGHIGNLKIREKLYKQIKQTIKPKGSVLIEMYSKNQLSYQTGGPKKEDMLCTPDEFLIAFKDFKIKHFFYGEKNREEGV